MSRHGEPPPRCKKCGGNHYNYVKCVGHDPYVEARKTKLHNKNLNTTFLFRQRSDLYGRTEWVPGDNTQGFHVNQWKGK